MNHYKKFIPEYMILRNGWIKVRSSAPGRQTESLPSKGTNNLPVFALPDPKKLTKSNNNRKILQTSCKIFLSRNLLGL